MSVDMKNHNKTDLPEINNRFHTKQILKDKSNYANTIKKFFNEDEEKVKNLNFFDPKIFSMENKDIVRSTSYGLFNIVNSTSKLKNKKSIQRATNNSYNLNNDISNTLPNQSNFYCFLLINKVFIQ